MSQVGAFPGMSVSHRRTIRGPINPMDKSTVVSIYPHRIQEHKPTIQPGVFVIDAGTYEKPAILVVGPSSWWRDIDEDQPLLEIPVSSIQIADSFVRDYSNGILGCDMDTARPGLFYVPGEYTVEGIVKGFKKELDSARERQKNWYNTLIKLADALWARSNGNPMSISEDMKFAARELGIEGKDWLRNDILVGLERCFACGNLKNPNFPVCPSCRAIDPNNPKAKDLIFAKQ